MPSSDGQNPLLRLCLGPGQLTHERESLLGRSAARWTKWVKYKFLKTIFIKIQIHQKQLSSKTTFIKNHFHQKNNFVKKHFLSDCLAPSRRVGGGLRMRGKKQVGKMGAWRKNETKRWHRVRVCVKASSAEGRRHLHPNTAYPRLSGFNKHSCGASPAMLHMKVC